MGKNKRKMYGICAYAEVLWVGEQVKSFVWGDRVVPATVL